MILSESAEDERTTHCRYGQSIFKLWYYPHSYLTGSSAKIMSQIRRSTQDVSRWHVHYTRKYRLTSCHVRSYGNDWRWRRRDASM